MVTLISYFLGFMGVSLGVGTAVYIFYEFDLQNKIEAEIRRRRK